MFEEMTNVLSMYQHFLKKTPLGADTFINLSDSVYKAAQTQ